MYLYIVCVCVFACVANILMCSSSLLVISINTLCGTSAFSSVEKTAQNFSKLMKSCEQHTFIYKRTEIFFPFRFSWFPDMATPGCQHAVYKHKTFFLCKYKSGLYNFFYWFMTSLGHLGTLRRLGVLLFVWGFPIPPGGSPRTAGSSRSPKTR